MKILFAGTPENAAQSLEALIRSGIEVVGVLTRPDAPVGRKRIITASPVALVADRHSIPVVKSNKVDAATIAKIKECSADLGVVVAYGSLLDSSALESLPLGWVNLHYSLLPSYRGAAPVQASILNGERETGVTVFQLDEGMDTGDVLIQVPTVIEPGENAQRLLSRLTDLGVTALLEVIPKIASGFLLPIKQDDAQASYAPKISRSDALIDWSCASSKVERLVNAMNPEPVAWTNYLSESFRILAGRSTQLADSNFVSNKPGLVTENSGRVFVTCGEGSSFELHQVQPAGKTPMPAVDWYRGQASKGPVVFE